MRKVRCKQCWKGEKVVAKLKFNDEIDFATIGLQLVVKIFTRLRGMQTASSCVIDHMYVTLGLCRRHGLMWESGSSGQGDVLSLL